MGQSETVPSPAAYNGAPSPRYSGRPPGRTVATGWFAQPVTLTAATPKNTRYVVIWFTRPGQFNDGYRAEVDDVKLR